MPADRIDNINYELTDHSDQLTNLTLRLEQVEETVKDCAQALAGVISIVEKAVEESGTSKIVLPR